jgi:serine/threonine-protein kinase
VHALKRRCAICHTSYVKGESFCPLDGGAIIADDGAATDDLVGTTVDERYLVTRLLGRGGMGKVYEADHVGLGKRVAIKFVSDADADREQRARFRQEARAASRIVHENVIQIFDVGADAGRDYLVMEYVEGRDLDAAIGEGVLPPARAIAIAQQILRGLHACHAAGIVHRDIKPSNIRLTNDHDFVKIMDFGISKSTHAHVAQTDTGTGRVIGTPEFMAPEQILDRDVDHRADIFAVGATLFAMLAGRPPFSGTSFTQRVNAMALAPPPIDQLRGGLPPSLVAAITRALAPDPADRFPSALAFADALQDGAVIAGARADAATRPARVTAFAPTATAPSATAPSPAAPSHRRAWMLIVAFLVLAIAAGGVTAWIIAGRTPAENRAVAVAIDAAPAVDAPIRLPIDAQIALVPIDAAIADAAPRKKSQPRELPAGTVIAVENKGKPCRCDFKTAKGSIDTACTTKRKEPRCRCLSTKDRSRDLCPQLITVTDEGKIQPDGKRGGQMNCVDRTRSECNPLDKAMPASCLLRYQVATQDAACSGFVPGQKDGDTPLPGTYDCSICDWHPDRPKFYGKTGDQCVGYSPAGDKVTGTLKCWN